MSTSAQDAGEVEVDDSEELEQALFEPDSVGTETEADITGAADFDFGKVVLAPSDWTVQTVLTQLNSESFELDPDFQRRNAWSDVRKSKFIESLILGLPIPQIVLAERDEGHGDILGDTRYVVIDGKQRLLALEAFYSDHDALKLTSLTVLRQLNGKTLADITADPTLSRVAKRLMNRTIRTVVIRQYPNESFLHLVFHRINHQTLPLSAQELRQALEPGPFTRFADRRAGSSTQLHRVLRTSQMPDFRMRDVELLVRFIAFKTRIMDYRGNLKKFLDDTCRELNAQWDSVEPEMRHLGNRVDAAIEVVEEIFGPNAFHRYTEEGSWEGRFNRAVFDIMCYYFADEEVSAKALDAPREVVATYEALSVDDPRFARSIAATTKTLPATIYRLEAWGRELADAINMDIAVPVLDQVSRTVSIEVAHAG
jgi:hypothetical protein